MNAIRIIAAAIDRTQSGKSCTITRYNSIYDSVGVTRGYNPSSFSRRRIESLLESSEGTIRVFYWEDGIKITRTYLIIEGYKG